MEEEAGEEAEDLSPWLKRLSTLCHLAVFGIFGTLLRYALQKRFAPSVGNVTAAWSALFLELPPNMVGCFFMGLIAVALKRHILAYWELLLLGLTTGLLGALTPLSGWIQSVTTILVFGTRLRAFIALVIGAELAMASFLVGVDAGKAVLDISDTGRGERLRDGAKPAGRCKADNRRRKVAFLCIFAALWLLILQPLLVMLVITDQADLEARRLWLACLIAPLGVWMRWWLAEFNQRTPSKERDEFVDWFPFGTFAANMLAILMEAGFQIWVVAAPENNDSLWVGEAIQVGIIGCLSTVSTLNEAYQLRAAEGSIRHSYMYLLITCVGGTLACLVVYGIPSWVMSYPSAKPP